ncbi:CocE/NonD family hydrolase [Shewanella sp. 202IG2-18]|uniref:CocE/NonD family hydrolase n=1 Tax=Parashewanella hymeniacidonis TaxID=2807618 RepID=UPI001960494F|nr:CocE/NonD family hydrolase [Parashewanella hymeniacidonis]MBM7074540.1 CocE/NonD family hydrolase [Parashewanella hymeniacidonis]
MTEKDFNRANSNPFALRFFSIFIAITLVFVIGNAKAKEKKQQTYTTPSHLTKAPMKNRQDALRLLEQDKFRQELLNLAKQIPTVTINEESMFNKVGLLSILNKHSTLIQTVAQHPNSITYLHYTLHSETQLKLKSSEHALFTDILTDEFSHSLTDMNDERLFQVTSALGWSVSRAQDYVYKVFKRYKHLPTLNSNQAINLIVNAHIYEVLSKVIPISKKLLSEESNQRYDIEPDVLIKAPNGVELSATIVKRKHSTNKLPTALQFTIYADESAHIQTAIHAAAHGYVGVVVNSRGKRSSSNKVIPWEHEGKDATSAIDWISKQPWSNGDVVMYGGSYNGFTQWAAAKHMHPALKAMSPYTAASLITGLPYENNIVLTGNYPWAFHVTNNKTMDNSVYADWQKSDQLLTSLFESGKATKDIDKIDGKPNPWFQKWLQHPSFDSYYQAMVPYQAEYANINIPVLSITGYFDGGQISALDYLKNHYKYNKNADHSLLIGPYNHGTAQGKPRSHHSNYKLDDAALEKDTEELVFEWFDHVLFNHKMPSLLKNKINYQLMGSNQWRHVSSLDELNNQSQTFFLTTSENESGDYSLSTNPEDKIAYVAQTVDLADRTTEHNKAPWPVIQGQLNESSGLVFMTDSFDESQELAGAITGHLSISINKKDVDIGYNFYEIDKEGNAFHLNNYRSRVSYANDMSQRELLKPNTKTFVPIVNARITAKLIKKGSKLVMVLNVNKNRDAQVNMGSGKDVSEETIQDAGENLNIKWFNDSQINIPLKPWKG